MKSKSLILISLLIVILSVISMIFLRETPVLSPWKNWKVLSVDKNIPEKTVLEELSKISINSVVSENSEKLNVTSKFAPVLPSEYNFYQENLHRYFYDKFQNYRLYYFPKNIKNKTLKSLPFEYNIDLEASFPFFSFILTIIAFVILLFLVKHKVIFGFTLLPLLLFTVVFPDFNSLIISLFSFVIVFFIDKYVNRKNILLAIFRNFFVILSFSLCIISSFLGGLKCSLLFLLSLMACLGIYLIFVSIFAFTENKKSNLKFVNIVSAPNITFENKNTLHLFYGLSVLILIGALSYLLIPSISAKTSNDTPLLIPTPLEYTNTRGFSIGSYSNLQTKKEPTDLPDLGDYVSQIWNATVFPYISLQDTDGYISNVIPETSVSTVDYFLDNDVIKSQTVEVAVFTKDFINSALEKITAGTSPVIENVLLDQESFCAADFGNVNRTTSFTLILFIIAILFSGIEIFIYFKYYKLGR